MDNEIVRGGVVQGIETALVEITRESLESLQERERVELLIKINRIQLTAEFKDLLLNNK